MDLRRAVPRTFEETADGGRARADSTGFDAGMLVLRLVVGLTMAAHGAQKLLGWFGGPGFTGPNPGPPNGPPNVKVVDGGKYDGTGFRSSSVSDESFPPNLVGFSLTFTKPGTFSYVCLIHPKMGGVVKVT